MKQKTPSRNPAFLLAPLAGEGATAYPYCKCTSSCHKLTQGCSSHTPAPSSLPCYCRHIVDETVKKWGRIDILVNNAALQDKKVDKFEEIGRERLERTFHTNILAYFTIAQNAVKHMQKGSAIINVASVQAYQPEPGILDYACTKVGLCCPSRRMLKEALY